MLGFQVLTGQLRLRDDDSTLSPRRFPRSYQRTPAGNKTTARGRSPGYRVLAGALLPKTVKVSVASWAFAIRLQLRGQPRFLTVFQLNPCREPCACLR